MTESPTFYEIIILTRRQKMTANALSHDTLDNRARVIGHVDICGEQEPPVTGNSSTDDFLTNLAATPWSGEQMQRDLDRILAEIAELQTENRWDDILALFHPVTEKLPELADSGMENEVRLKIGFVLCRAGRHAEAITCLTPVTEQDPENCMSHYTLAYTALDALFTARTSRQPMPYKEKKRLLATGHTHFQEACRLRPESVTFFYRHAVLYKDIENKTRQAIPLFEQAVANWERKDDETRKKQHQQYPKYIKAMYHLASCFLADGRPGRSIGLIEKVIELDRDRDHMQPVFKHFAMGKVLHALGRPEKALEHLEVAAYRADRGQAVDFVHELAARCGLILQQPERAAKYIDRIPQSQRRPYVRWTEADVLVARGQREKALKVLAATAERDRRSRHKALIRMARIQLTTGEWEDALRLSSEAVEFCRKSFGNPSHEALFWQAAALYRLERFSESLEIITELEEHRFRYPNFNRLAGLVRDGIADTGKDKGLFALVKGSSKNN
jgi:tetratricopeptide (TPR) repeat protein